MEFRYLAFTKSGKKKTGTIEAENIDKAAKILQEKDWKIVELVEASPFDFQKLLEINIGGVPLADTVIFFRQMSYMLGAGLPLINALSLLKTQARNRMMKKALACVEKEVRGGAQLSLAMGKHPKVFDKVAINLIKAGEESGNLDVVFDRLATDYEKKQILQGKIKGAMVYPIIILVVVVVVVIALLVFMIPSVEEMFKEFGAEGQLPTATKLLVSISNGIRGLGGVVALVVLAALFFLYKWYRSTEGGREVTDSLILRIPVFGELTRKTTLARFARTFSMLLGSGVEILTALRLTSESLSNVIFSDALKRAEKTVEKGGMLSVVLASEEAFPPIVSEMVKVGETTGKTDEIMGKIADYYEREVDQLASNLTRMLEPIIMIVVGGIVAFIAIAVYSPLLSLGNVIK